ncbi:MAG: azurin [Bacteroidota bacterium]
MNQEIGTVVLASFIKQVTITMIISLIWGCGNGSNKGKTEPTQNEASSSSETDENGLVKLVINSNDEMRYDKDELRVKAGTMIELTLNHTGQLPKEAMGHNVVILKQGVDIVSYAGKAYTAVDNEYVPDTDKTIAYTKLIGGGESTKITFEAPASGSYDFICTFPGHFALMQGKFIVE